MEKCWLTHLCSSTMLAHMTPLTTLPGNRLVSSARILVVNVMSLAAGYSKVVKMVK